VEKFADEYLRSDAGAAHLRWLRALARHGGPRLQRVLRIERLADGGGRVVFEAVNGKPTPPRELDAAERARLLEAVEALHDSGAAHGAIAESIVREDFGPTLIVAGRAPRGATPDDDRRALAESPSP